MVSVVLVHCGWSGRLLDIHWDWETRMGRYQSSRPDLQRPQRSHSLSQAQKPDNSATNSLKREPTGASSRCQPSHIQDGPRLGVVLPLAGSFKATASQLRGAGRNAVSISKE